MMPGMDGYEVLAELRANPITHAIPVIFVTAKDDVADIEQGLNLGADDYIPKPIKPREVLARARGKIEQHRLRKTLQQRTTELETLLRFSEELNNYIEVEPLQDLMLILVLDIIPCLAAVIYRTGEDGEVLNMRYQIKTEDLVFDFDANKLLDNILTSDEHMLVWEDNERDLTNLHYGMAVRLQHVTQLHGILVVVSDEPFSERHAMVFEAISRQATLAMRNADLYAIKVNYAEHLEDMVEERTAELRSAQALLARADKLAAVGRLAAGIAHEINNPLMPIRVNLELMQEDVQNGSPIHLEDIEESLHSVNRISRIVERLQQFTRKRGDEAPDMEPLAIEAVINSVIGLSDTYLRHSRIQLALDLTQDAYVYGNRDQLEQVFLNIILNAQAAMPDGGKLTIRSTVEGDRVRVVLSDTGHGIPEEIIDSIFEPFLSTKEDGSGLGLFISHNIIDNHSGQIEVESTVNEGTTFTLWLPAITETAD
jgi:signal transduction histidine kinase